MTFYDWVHERFSSYVELDRKLQLKLQTEWEKLQSNLGSNLENTYHPINDDQESNDDEFIDGLDDYLNMDHYFKPLDKEEESFMERKFRLLGIPYQKPPTFTAEKYEVVKYPFGPMEEYAAITTTKYKELA